MRAHRVWGRPSFTKEEENGGIGGGRGGGGMWLAGSQRVLLYSIQFSIEISAFI